MNPRVRPGLEPAPRFEALQAQNGEVADQLHGIASMMAQKIYAITESIQGRIEPFEGRSEQPELTQATVNGAVAEIAGHPHQAEGFLKASELFRVLDRTTKRAVSDGRPDTLLIDGLAALVYTEFGKQRGNRSNERRIRHLPSTRELIGHCEQVITQHPEPIPIDQMIRLQDIVLTARTSKYQVDEYFNQTPTNEIDAATIANFAANLERIHPQTDLSPAQLLVFMEALKIFKQESVMGAVFASGGESTKVAAEAPHGPYYETAFFIDYARDSDQSIVSHVRMLRRGHAKGRPLGIPNRQFSRSMNRLAQLGMIYHNLTVDQQLLRKLPELASSLRRDSTGIQKAEVNLLVLDAVGALQDGYHNMVDLVNQRLQEADTHAEQEHLWELAAQFDEAKIELGHWFKDRLESLGIDPDDDLLKSTLDPEIIAQMGRRSEARRQAELAREIEPRLEEFAAIEKSYVLSNSQLRQRHPDLITLAKQIGDSLSEHENVSTEILRSFTGLLLGVYWERTGQGASTESLARDYTQDAQSLRALSGELETLGQTCDSKLLRMMNLLDELIESGFFENSQFERFSGFVIDYLLTLDGKSGAADSKKTEQDNPTLPVEAMLKADYEDIKVFPPSTTAGEAQDDYLQNITEKDLPTIEWERIVKLIELRDQFNSQGLETTLIRTKHASWQVLPFFVLEVRLPKQPVAVAVVESPVYGNATYVYREAADRPSWRDVVQLERHEAREFGAVPKVHIDSNRPDNHLVKIWNHVISDLTIRR